MIIPVFLVIQIDRDHVQLVNYEHEFEVKVSNSSRMN